MVEPRSTVAAYTIDELIGVLIVNLFNAKTPLVKELDARCQYGIFSRYGGVSPAPYDSLNIGLAVGDRDEWVLANREVVKKRMDVQVLCSARQVHGDRIYVLGDHNEHDLEVDGYDAIVTDRPGVGLMIQQADCQAILLYAPEHHVIGAVHCGWRGSVLELISKTIALMEKRYGITSQSLHAVVSPSLGPCCAEFVNFRQELPESFQQHMTAKAHFDFWAISQSQLMASGVSKAQIILPDTCTSCSLDYFSYRRACREGDGITGRCCSVIALAGTGMRTSR